MQLWKRKKSLPTNRGRSERVISPKAASLPRLLSRPIWGACATIGAVHASHQTGLGRCRSLPTPTPLQGSHGPHESRSNKHSLAEEGKWWSNSSSAHLNTFASRPPTTASPTGQPPCNVRADFRLTAPPIPALRTAREINSYRNGGLHIPTRQDPWPPRQEPKEACSNVAFPSLRGQTSAAQACGVHGGVALQSSAPRLSRRSHPAYTSSMEVWPPLLWRDQIGPKLSSLWTTNLPDHKTPPFGLRCACSSWLALHLRAEGRGQRSRLMGIRDDRRRHDPGCGSEDAGHEPSIWLSRHTMNRHRLVPLRPQLQHAKSQCGTEGNKGPSRQCQRRNFLSSMLLSHQTSEHCDLREHLGR